MKLLRNIFVPVFSHAPNTKEASVKSHQLLLQYGFIKQVSSGLFTLLPMALRVLKKIEFIIDEEMEVVNAQKISMPIIVPSELWKQSGRLAALGEELVQFKDRRGNMNVVSPTHEECVTNLVASFQISHHSTPLLLYQIGNKYRDELRPRHGLVRTREFIMKDLYSFHANEECAKNTYKQMLSSYSNIFSRLKLPFVKAKAVTGAMGGSNSHEFHAITPIGEDHLYRCTKCDFVCNKELLEDEEELEGEEDSKKQKNNNSNDNGSATMKSKFNCFDTNHDATAGSNNGNDQQCSFVDPKFNYAVNIINNNEKKENKRELLTGVEIGHCFLLGTRYSAAFDANVSGSKTPFFMGCYGIGVTRLLSVCAEIHNDEKGLKWPISIAPYLITIVFAHGNDKFMERAKEIYEYLQQLQLKIPSSPSPSPFQYQTLNFKGEVIVDDSPLRTIGAKLKLSEQLGIPITMVIGQRNFPNVDIQFRHDGSSAIISTMSELESLLQAKFHSSY